VPSVFELNLRYFSGAWIADISCITFVVVAARKLTLALSVFLMHVPQFQASAERPSRFTVIF